MKTMGVPAAVLHLLLSVAKKTKRNKLENVAVTVILPRAALCCTRTFTLTRLHVDSHSLDLAHTDSLSHSLTG